MILSPRATRSGSPDLVISRSVSGGMNLMEVVSSAKLLSRSGSAVVLKTEAVLGMGISGIDPMPKNDASILNRDNGTGKV